MAVDWLKTHQFARLRLERQANWQLDSGCKSREKEKVNHHFYPEPCVRHREVPDEASVGVPVGRAIEPRKYVHRECREFQTA